jgi:HEAT repeat protein
VRKEVVRAVGSHLGRRRLASEPGVRDLIDRAVCHLLADGKHTSLLEDIYLRVRNKTAGALALLGDARAIGPLTERLRDERFQNPKLLCDTAVALGRLLAVLKADTSLAEEVRGAAVAELQRQLRDSPNDSVRQAAAQALGEAGAVETVEFLIERFRAAVRSGQEEFAKALKEAACALAPDRHDALTDLEKRIGRRWSQQRRKALLDATLDLKDRLLAARELGEYQDERGLKALAMTAAHPDVSPELRAVCEEAIARIQGAKP